MFWLCSGEIKSQYPKYCLTAAWRVLVTLYFSAIISPLNKTNCWRIFFPNIDGVKSTALWNSTKKDNINSSVQFSCSVVSDSLRPHGLQHTRPPCPSPIPRAYSNSCPSSWGCHPTREFQSLSSPSPPDFNLSQHQGLFQWLSSSHQVAKVLEFQLQHQSFQWTSRTDLL